MPADIMPKPPVSVNVDEILVLFAQKRFDVISDRFLSVLEHFRDNTYFVLRPEEQYFIDQFVKIFLFILSEPAFVISERYVLRYLSMNQVISNIVATSGIKTTDAYVEIVLRQQDNLVRLLTIYSARNRVKLDRKMLMDTNAPVTSVWFGFYGCSYYGALVSQVGWENLREHYSYTDPRLRIAHQIQETFFGSTYAGGARDQVMKPVVNKTVREAMGATRIIRATPNKRKYALISAFWVPTTSVYRIIAAYVRALKPDFHMTFIQLIDGPAPEPGFWDDVRRINFTAGGLDASGLKDADYQILHFPDIGMSDGSIALANLRIAPIQIMSPGHPVSTFGAQIDYFMSGENIEPPENPEKNYSERLVMMPGMGMAHHRPYYSVKGLKKHNDVLLINLPAWCQKVNYQFVQALKKIQAATHTKFKIRLFSGKSLCRAGDYIPFVREMAGQLGPENLEVMPDLPYETYMAEMERADLALDAYHFGGGNTVSDNLFVGAPMICWEGDQWYNRIGPATLRLATLPELIATNEQEYVDLAVKLIDDEEYRNSLRRKLSELNLDDLIYRHDDAKYFNKALHYLIDNHETLQQDTSRTPIRIPRD